MSAVAKLIETVLFGGRLLLVPVYLAMLVLLGMLVVYFFAELIHAVPALPKMHESDVIILTLSLIDLSLSANLVVLVIISGYENFVRRVAFKADDTRPEWMAQVDFAGLKLKMLGSMTVIAAVHLLGSLLDVDAQSNRSLLWQVIIVVVFAVCGLVMALTDRLGEHHE